jgi:alkanesulfonate monooxygenase SsuD/methylene tetrahydromethanopterin reductase-like flavin-dependent oxidoreductase (luciferase family)
MTQQKMQFGLAIRGQYASNQNIQTCFEELIAECKAAEALGFDSITKTSHYSTAPFQAFQQFPILARLSAETSRVRLNAGIILLSLHKPLDIAEQLATIDIMSGGRLICGVALGYREVEFAAFGSEVKKRGKLLEENLIALKQLWTEDTVTMKGSHFELKNASCCPKPLQRPHPAIWIGANANPAIKRAAKLGDCWYINPHNRISDIKEQIEVYKWALDECGKPFPDELPMRREVFVAETREEALRLAGPYLKKKYDAYQNWGQGDQLPEGDRNLGLAFNELAGDRFIIGSPDDVTEQIVNLNKEVGTNHLIMSIQWADMPHSLTMDTLAILGEKVIPQVRQAMD